MLITIVDIQPGTDDNTVKGGNGPGEGAGGTRAGPGKGAGGRGWGKGSEDRKLSIVPRLLS